MFYTSMTVLGGDLRQCYLAEYMCSLGHDVTCFSTVPFPFSSSNSPFQADSLQKALEEARLVIGPVPFSKDGVFLYQEQDGGSPLPLDSLKEALHPGQILLGFGIPGDFAAACRDSGISVRDISDSETLARENAAFTAEGLLSSIIAETPFSLKGRRALLLGHGRCGQEIVKLFTKLGVTFTILDKDPNARALAQPDCPAVTFEDLSTIPMDFDLIINTIPARLFSSEQTAQLPEYCVLFDIASAPYGFDSKHAVRKLVRCPGIPGKTMPKTAGEFLGKVIIERMLSYGI